MIPAAFDYVAPESLDEAIRALSDGGEEAKLLAGGHSLLPLMKLRFANPVAPRRSPAGSRAERGAGRQRERRADRGDDHPRGRGRRRAGPVQHGRGRIADPQVRNRGTIGGSLAAAHPAADLPAAVLAAEGTIVAQGPGGSREIPAAEFFRGYLQTGLEPDEVITEIRLPSTDGWSAGYEKFARRQEDWAMVGVCALVRIEDGVCADARIGLTHMGGTPVRARAAEAELRGQAVDADAIARAAAQAAEGTDPPADLNASAEYRAHLARVLCRRALTQAVG